MPKSYTHRHIRTCLVSALVLFVNIGGMRKIAHTPFTRLADPNADTAQHVPDFFRTLRRSCCEVVSKPPFSAVAKDWISNPPLPMRAV